MRGKLWMAGVRPSTSVCAAADVLEVVLFETPREELEKRRRRLDIQVVRAQAAAGTYDRDRWGMEPEQQAATRRLMGGP